MKLLDAKVNWRLDWANPPELNLVVDTLPDQERIYERRGDLFYSEVEGIVRFYSYNTVNQTGFGGSTFQLKLTDGTTVSLKGPWSSRAGVMNKAGFTPCLDIALTPQDKGWYLGCSITKELAEEAIRSFLPGVELYQETDHSGEITYRPTLVGMTPDQSKQHLRERETKQ